MKLGAVGVVHVVELLRLYTATVQLSNDQLLRKQTVYQSKSVIKCRKNWKIFSLILFCRYNSLAIHNFLFYICEIIWNFEYCEITFIRGVPIFVGGWSTKLRIQRTMKLGKQFDIDI